MPVDRTEFATRLRDVAVGSLSLPEFRSWVRSLIIGHPIISERREDDLIFPLVERLDTVNDDDARLRELASEFSAGLRTAGWETFVGLLLELAVNRVEVLNIVAKYRAAIVTRTHFLSYLAESQWPPQVRARITGMSAENIAQMHAALNQRDYESLARMFA